MITKLTEVKNVGETDNGILIKGKIHFANTDDLYLSVTEPIRKLLKDMYNVETITHIHYLNPDDSPWYNFTAIVTLLNQIVKIHN